MSNFDDNPYAVNNTPDDYSSYGTPPQNVPDYLVPSILVTLFCCQILGIIAIVFSAMASSEKGTGNYAQALNYANNAKICLIIGVIGGALVTLPIIAMIVISAASGNM